MCTLHNYDVISRLDGPRAQNAPKGTNSQMLSNSVISVQDIVPEGST
jgi:hypothetical protein